MAERCIYCGMEIEGEGVTREIEGDKIKFCSPHCSVMFGGLEKKGRMKAVIMAERAEILSKLEEERGTKVITLHLSATPPPVFGSNLPRWHGQKISFSSGFQ